MSQSAVSALEEIVVEQFDLSLTLNCGQVFHWQRLGPGWCGAIGQLPVYLEQRGNCLLVTRGSSAAVREYLALDHPITEIYESFPADPAMQEALQLCRGLRIIRQPLWECLATFITSALKQVAHIAQISHLLRQRFGQAAGEIGGHILHAYPTVGAIASQQESELRACGLGFRSVSLLASARRIVETDSDGDLALEQLRAGNRGGTLEALTDFRGVGTKVANCVLLFGYGYLDAFPIDVWIERVLREKYFPGEPRVSLAMLQSFAEKHFGPYGGYAQQYLFHHARVMKSVHRAEQKTPQSKGNALPIRRVRSASRRG